MARRATASRAFALLAAMTLAGCIAAPGATDPAAAHQRAQTVLSAWAEAVAAAGEHAAVTPVRELTSQIGDWEEAVGDNNKRALMAGMIASDRPLSEDAPPDGEVEWQDGTTTKVPLISAQQAIVAMESTTEAPCSDCTMLLVTEAQLTSGPIQTTRGPATAPIWEFTVEGTLEWLARAMPSHARMQGEVKNAARSRTGRQAARRRARHASGTGPSPKAESDEAGTGLARRGGGGRAISSIGVETRALHEPAVGLSLPPPLVPAGGDQRLLLFQHGGSSVVSAGIGHSSIRRGAGR